MTRARIDFSLVLFFSRHRDVRPQHDSRPDFRLPYGTSRVLLLNLSCLLDAAAHGGLGFSALVAGCIVSGATVAVAIPGHFPPAALLRAIARSPVRALRVATVVQVGFPRISCLLRRPPVFSPSGKTLDGTLCGIACQQSACSISTTFVVIRDYG